MFNITSQKKKILIVDDDRSIRDLLLELLSDTHDCTACSSPAEALQMAAGGGYSLVITDVEMPEFNGVELCRTLRKISPATAVIVISGNPDANIRTRALEAGAANFISKPFDLFDLEASVKSSISKSDFRISSSRIRALNFAIALD